MTTLRLWWLLRRHENRTSRLPTILAVVAFAVSTGALLVTVSGLWAFWHRFQSPGGGSDAVVYVVLACIAAGLMAVPVLTLGGLAARLTISRRNHRLATLRLAGATSGQVAGITIAETAAQATVGALAGSLGYAALLPLLARLTFDRQAFAIGDLWIGIPLLGACVAGIVVLSMISGLVSMAAVVVTPLGVAARARAGRVSLIRGVLFGAVVVAWLLASGGALGASWAVLLALLVGLIASINLVGPLLLKGFGHIVASLARGPALLLAGRRIIDDPRAAWRAASAMGLMVLLATIAAVSGAITDGTDATLPTLGTDMRTGALIALLVTALVAATSAGVVHAARVIDQTGTYRALGLAGCPDTVLLRARRLEVVLPLGLAVSVAGPVSAVILVPFSVVQGPTVLLWFGAGVVGAAGLSLAGLAASRSLVSEAIAR